MTAPTCHTWTRAEYDAHMALVHRQTMEAIRGEIGCATCGRSLPARWLYRCYHCGLWFCERCGAGHFGSRPVGRVEG